MNASVFYGYYCPKCRSSVRVLVVVGGETTPRCSNCGATMLPDKTQEAIAANVHCKKCNIMYGLVTSDKCPQCGERFS